jgi:DNA polymerase-3 subunit chi
MTEIRFYHLLKTPEAQALPQIAMKAWQAGARVVVKASDTAHVNTLNDALWTYKADSFLPHGTGQDGDASKQPVYLTAGDDNPNGAKTLILATGCTHDNVQAYDLCCAMLDGHNEAQITEARTRWKEYRHAGHSVSYWQQTDQGWEKKA